MKCLTHASGIIWKVELDTSACMISTQRFAVCKCHYESSHHCVPKMGPGRGVEPHRPGVGSGRAPSKYRCAARELNLIIILKKRPPLQV